MHHEIRYYDHKPTFIHYSCFKTNYVNGKRDHSCAPVASKAEVVMTVIAYTKQARNLDKIHVEYGIACTMEPEFIKRTKFQREILRECPKGDGWHSHIAETTELEHLEEFCKSFGLDPRDVLAV